MQNTSTTPRYMGTYVETVKKVKYHVSFTYELKDGNMVNQKEVSRVKLSTNLKTK